MLIGVPKEIKSHEYRVGLVPASVREAVHHGHAIIVESGAGARLGFDDAGYSAAGAEVVDTAAEVFARAELVVKVKEPQSSECRSEEPTSELQSLMRISNAVCCVKTYTRVDAVTL